MKYRIVPSNFATANEQKFWGTEFVDLGDGQRYWPLPDRYEGSPASERLFRRKYLPEIILDFDLGTEYDMAWRIFAYKSYVSKKTFQLVDMPILSEVFTWEDEVTNPCSWKPERNRLMGMRAYVRLDMSSVDLFLKLDLHSARMCKEASKEIRRYYNEINVRQ